jgi:hypothetical protein
MPVPPPNRTVRADRPVPLYGLDIETDTTIDGLDPSCAAVVAVGLATPDRDDRGARGVEAVDGGVGLDVEAVQGRRSGGPTPAGRWREGHRRSS